MTPPRPDLARATFVHVAVAALAMGGWAAFANRHAPYASQLRASLLQAALSGAITAGLKHALERLAKAFRGPRALFAPPLLTSLATLAMLVGAHAAAHTPDLWRTIALPYAVSTSYAWLYSLDLQRRRGRPARRAA